MTSLDRLVTRRFSATAALAAALLGAGCATPPPAALPAVDTRHIAALDPGSALPAGWQHGTFIEIFVRGFNDSDGDGIGDLRGLIRKLDYLRDLGIKGIWLMPVTPSADHDHGYATTDYRNIEPDYGTLADFDALLEQAHARGIGVIIDDVVNHSAATNPLFVNAASGPGNRYRDWYVWRDTAPTGWDIWGKNPWTTTAQGAYYATFGPQMPDFNLKRAEVVEFHEDNLRFWLNRGLDGFRLDAVPHLIENGPQAWNDQPESRRLTHRLVALIHRYAHRHVVCEATANPQAYAADAVCGSAFAFGHQYQIVQAAKGDAEAIRAVAEYFRTAPAGMATMVSNHDIFAGERLWDQVGGNLAQYRLAAATYLLQPGTPYIYYGEEIGMAGVKQLPGDAALRTPMSWTADPHTAGFTTGVPFRPVSPNAATQNAAAQAADPNSLLAFYKAMLRLRNTLPSIAQGRYMAPFVSGKVLGYQRQFEGERTLVLINYDSAAARVEVGGLPAGGTLVAAFPADAARAPVGAAGAAQIALAAQEVRVYVIRP